jgi:DNA-binding IclR family transcriptional regulator
MTRAAGRGAKAKPEAVQESMKSVRGALRLLMEFTGEQASFTVGELAARTGMGKSHVSKSIAAFVESGVLMQDPRTRAISVGMRAFVLGARFINQDRLSREAMPVMRDLMQRTGHSTRLSVLNGDRVLYLVGVEGPMFVDTGWRAGTWLPVHSTTAGRVLLAFLGEARAAQLLAKKNLVRLTPHTVTDRKALERILARIRSTGFDVQRNETTQGLGTIGAPVFDKSHAVIGALSVAFPSHVLLRNDEASVVEHLHASCRALSQRMSCPVYPFGGVQAARRSAAR